MQDDYTPTRVCSKCKQEFPATTEYFYQEKRTKIGLQARCKTCHEETMRPYRPKPKYKVQAQPGHKFCHGCKQEFPATTEYFSRDKSQKDGLQSHCKKCCSAANQAWNKANADKNRERKRLYHEVHRERISEKSRLRRLANHEQMLERDRRYYEASRDKRREDARKYRESHPEQLRINKLRRRARKRSLPDTFTPEQWQACLEYHNHCCAVCGKQLYDLWGEVEPHADHWIPLSYDGDDNPGTVAENMICLCNHCNSSKRTKMPADWLKKEYGSRKANEILLRIQTYFEQVKPE